MSSMEKENNASSQPKPTKDIKELTDICGDIGPFNFMILGVCLLSALMANWNAIGQVFLAFPVNHFCARPLEFQNMSVEQWKDISIPKEEIRGKSVSSKCMMYDLSNYTDETNLLNEFNNKMGENWTPSDKKISCTAWEFDRTFWTSSIVDQFYLVCTRSYMVSLSQAIYMSGFFVSVFIFGQIGDVIGRRPVVLICATLAQVSCFVLPFANTITFYAIIRFFVAMGAHGLFTTSFVIMMEYSSAKYRPLFAIGMSAGWATGFLTLPGVGWLTRHWFTFQLTVACVSLLFFLFWWIVPESARWLISQGKYEEAKKYLEKAAMQNGKWTKDTPDIIDTYISTFEIARMNRSNNGKEKKASILDCLRTPNMRKKSLTMFYAWFVTSFVYYGLSLNTGSLGGNYFINLAIAGAVEFPSFICAFLLIQFLGRKKPLAFVLIVGGGCCLGIIPLSDDMVGVRVALGMVGKSGVNIAFSTIYIYSAEIFPTVVRNVGVGTSSTFARLGAIIAPFIKELGKATNPSVPLAIFGGLTVFGALLVLIFLPETRNQVIPETLEEGEDFGRKKLKANPSMASTESVTSRM